jgi:hypothetical protein
MKHLRLASPALLAFGLASLLAQPVHAQQSWAPAPQEYPAVKLPAGLTSAPIINSHNKALYRTRLVTGSLEGSNFGGHYALLSWGCGEGCTTFFILDELNGHVFDPGFNLTAAKGATAGAGFGLKFQPDSRLLVMEGCRSTAVESCGRYYMLWTGAGFETLLREPQNLTVALNEPSGQSGQ